MSDPYGSPWDDPYEDEPECCWSCHGEGGFHDCGEDTCCCADPEDVESDDWCWCDECGGSGYIR